MCKAVVANANLGLAMLEWLKAEDLEVTFDKREEDTRVRGESEEKVALPRAAAWEQAASSREETLFATMAEEGPR